MEPRGPDHVSHGPAVKYISAVDTRFWEPDGLAPSTLWDGIGSVWEGTDNQPEQDGGFALSVYSGGPYVFSSTQYPGQLSQLYPSVAPFATRFVDWPSTPHVLTGYSIPAPGEVTTIARTLADPFGDRLFFAGEQACPGFFGYMEGALLSGLTAGRTSYRFSARARYPRCRRLEVGSRETPSPDGSEQRSSVRLSRVPWNFGSGLVIITISVARARDVDSCHDARVSGKIVTAA